MTQTSEWMSLRDVCVDLGQGAATTRALRGVTLTVRPGDRVGVMGASGSGKSTLLQILCRLRRPSKGSIAVTETLGMPSLVFQFPEHQLFADSVTHEVAYGLREGGVAAAEVAARVDTSLRAVGLDPDAFAERVPFHLSGGEQRRVALAGALAQKRPLILFDEPTLGLDAAGVADLERILAGLARDGVSYWIATHDADFLAATCTRLVVLSEGELAYDGAPDALWQDADACERFGVSRPLRARLARRLAGIGCTGLSPHPEEGELVTALQRLRSGA